LWWEQHGFGQLDFYAARRQAMLPQEFHSPFHEAGTRELAWHHVDSHPRFGPRAMMPTGRR
jgi:hypothetical protein